MQKSLQLRHGCHNTLEAVGPMAREVSRARAFDSPVPGEGRMPEQPGRRRTADGSGGERDDFGVAGVGPEKAECNVLIDRLDEMSGAA
jgi:hypothetical protein